MPGSGRAPLPCRRLRSSSRCLLATAAPPAAPKREAGEGAGPRMRTVRPAAAPGRGGGAEKFLEMPRGARMVGGSP